MTSQPTPGHSQNRRQELEGPSDTCVLSSLMHDSREAGGTQTSSRGEQRSTTSSHPHEGSCLHCKKEVLEVPLWLNNNAPE